MDYENIESAKYTFENEYIFCVIGGAKPVSVSVPVNTGNADYNKLMEMVSDGDLAIAEAG
tara:strand:+ start:383 stop:562 length:180 start_codon:yes stop_codon:yes gene_type:complete